MHKFFLFLFVLSLNPVFSQENVVWKFKSDDRIYSSPIIEGDVIYVGSGDHNFYAIDKNTGAEIWNFKTGGAVHSSPFILNNNVYFGSADGNLYAVNKEDGELLWKFKSEGEKSYGLWDYYLSSPKGDKETIYWGSGDGNVYAIEGNSGELKWKFETADIVHASPVVYNGNIYIGSFDGYFYCIEKEKGTLVWKFKTVGATYFPKGEIQKAALIKDDIVYFGSRDYNIYALDAKTGRGMWNRRDANGWIIATPVAYKDNIYFGTSDAHKFYAMHKDYGTTTWTAPIHMRVYGTATAYNDIIYFGTFDGKLTGVDYLTGGMKWEFQTESSKSNYSQIYNDEGEFKKGFEIYGAEYEASEAKIHTLGSILSNPIIENDIVYFGSSDGYLYAVKLK